jgi:hypothetical protein
VVGRHVHDDAEAKTKNDALLHPRVHAPTRWSGAVGFGGARGPGRERGAKPDEYIARTLAIGRRAGLKERSYF